MSEQYMEKYLNCNLSEITILYKADQAAQLWQDTAPISLDNSNVLQLRDTFQRPTIIITIEISHFHI